VLEFTSAGGEALLLLRADGDYQCLESAGSPFGFVKDAVYDKVSAAIAEGDSLLLFSDGAVEIMNPAREILGLTAWLISSKNKDISLPG